MTRPATSATDDTGQLPTGATHGRIMLADGGGGQLTDELVSQMVLPRLGNDVLDQLLDAATLPAGPRQRPALTIDSYVVQPWRFAGGDIGRLAVCGTVNDLAVSGARPAALALSLVITEGFSRRDLGAVLDSIAAASKQAGVRVVTGDTKVIDRGPAPASALAIGPGSSPGHTGDNLFITTAGLGWVADGCALSPRRVQPGDCLLINGPIGEHGLAVMLARQMPEVTSVLRSDVAPLNHLIGRVLDELGEQVAFMRDPTRSGLAGVAADLAQHSGRHVVLEEQAIVVRPAAQHAAEMLGLDPLEIANEGKVVLVVRAPAAARALALLRDDPLGRDAAVIGRIDDPADGLCELHTTLGGRRIVAKPYGEQLPRIC